MPYQNDINAQLSDLGYVTHLVNQDSACTPIRKSLILGSSAAAVPLTGTVAETVLATVNVPAGLLGASGWVRVHMMCSYTNNANAKNIACRLGGIAGWKFYDVGFTTNLQSACVAGFMNRAAASQVGITAPFTTGLGSTAAAAIATAAVDTSQAQQLVITGKLASAADTLTLEGFILEVCAS